MKKMDGLGTTLPKARADRSAHHVGTIYLERGKYIDSAPLLFLAYQTAQWTHEATNSINIKYYAKDLMVPAQSGLVPQPIPQPTWMTLLAIRTFYLAPCNPFTQVS